MKRGYSLDIVDLTVSEQVHKKIKSQTYQQICVEDLCKWMHCYDAQVQHLAPVLARPEPSYLGYHPNFHMNSQLWTLKNPKSSNLIWDLVFSTMLEKLSVTQATESLEDFEMPGALINGQKAPTGWLFFTIIHLLSPTYLLGWLETYRECFMSVTCYSAKFRKYCFKPVVATPFKQ